MPSFETLIKVLTVERELDLISILPFFCCFEVESLCCSTSQHRNFSLLVSTFQHWAYNLCHHVLLRKGSKAAYKIALLELEIPALNDS